MTSVGFTGVTKAFGSTPALRGFDLEVAEGELVVLLGPSGSGKTTALRVAAGLESPDKGSIRLGDRDVTADPAGARNVAMVFQGPSLFPNLDVRANVGFGPAARKVPRSERDGLVERAARVAGCEELLDRRPDQLSGGELQRVALARALARSPDVFLLDEPLSSLDAPVRTALREEVRRVQREVGGTMVYVTHDQDEALLLGDRVAVVVDGAVRQVGVPERVYADPVDRVVASFVGAPGINLVPAVRMQGAIRAGPFRVEADAEAVTEIGVRPEDVVLAGESQGHDAIVRLVVTTGADRFATVDAGGVHLVLRLPSGVRPAEGDRIAIAPTPRRALLFDQAGLTCSSIEGAR